MIKADTSSSRARVIAIAGPPSCAGDVAAKAPGPPLGGGESSRSGAKRERNVVLVFIPLRRGRQSGHEPRMAIHAGVGQSLRLVAATARCQLQRRLVGCSVAVQNT